MAVRRSAHMPCTRAYVDGILTQVDELSSLCAIKDKKKKKRQQNMYIRWHFFLLIWRKRERNRRIGVKQGNYD